MTRPKLEVADIFRRFGDSYLKNHPASATQRRLMRAISQCRTAQLGGHIDQSSSCGYKRVSYNSCRNRHCPKCQGMEKARWVMQREAELLPVDYFHVVFTVPEQVAAIALQNKRVVYNILFRAASETLRRIAADPKHLGAEIGFVAVLHTWGQNLSQHAHLHAIVTGGGLSADGSRWVSSRWVSCRKRFFLPVKVLSRLFRGLFLYYLGQAFDQQELNFHGELEHLSQEGAFSDFLSACRQKEWVVVASPPMGGAAQVLKYLGRYRQGVAITNHRLLSLEDGKVSFLWKDYVHNNQQRAMSLDAHEFIRRFLLHVLPDGFMRIRH